MKQASPRMPAAHAIVAVHRDDGVSTGGRRGALPVAVLETTRAFRTFLQY
jgi:hypothetical protein